MSASTDVRSASGASDLATRIESYFDRLWPINRSITGPGFRESLDILAELVPTERLRFPTGSIAFDWIVPPEWHAREAYLVDPAGRRFGDFAENNLHLVGYSIPFRGRMSLDELRPHLYSLPDQPDAIPFITSYYSEHWGFCLTDRELRQLPEGEYEVVIDAEHYAGHVDVGEAVLPGETEQEILFTSYLCHPSLANNELSGPLALAFLYERVAALPRRRFTYRFVLAAETIGAICYLSARGEQLLANLAAGYVMTCLADRGDFTYKLSRRADTLADRAARLVLRDHGAHTVIPFDPGNGSDERQYCSPGFNLPVGSLMRSMYADYPEYHTSLDNKDAISFDALAGSVEVYARVVDAIEANETWWNTVQFGEPQLGRRDLYPSWSTGHVMPHVQLLTWILNLADGEHDLLAIAEEAGYPVQLVVEGVASLESAGLLERR